MADISGNGYLTGSYGDDTIHGGAGDDYISDTNSGNDAFYGGDGNDTLYIGRPGAPGTSVTLDGGAGNDTFNVIDLHDSSINVYGGAGNDSISAGGAETITLGPGADVVNVQTYNTSVVTITDFSLGMGPEADLLDLRDLLTNEGWDGNSDPFATGLAKLVTSGSNLLVQVINPPFSYAPITAVVLDGLAGQSIGPTNFIGLHLAAPISPTSVTPTAVINSFTDTSEGGGFGLAVTLKNVAAASGSITVSVDPSSTATYGADFNVALGTTSYSVYQTPSGDYRVDLGTLNTVLDHQREPTETIVLDISAPGYVFSNGSDTGTVTISLEDTQERTYGTFSADTLNGTSGDDYILAQDGNDVIKSSAGLDIIDGGPGVDRLDLSGFSRDYMHGVVNGTGQITGGPEGENDTLTSVENITFLDGTLTFDQNSAAAQVVRLYDSFLGRSPDAAGFESYLRFVAGGHSFQDIASNAAASAEFHDATANLTDEQYITYVYEHSLHREPDPGGLQAYEDALANGSLSRTSMIVQAAESPEHIALEAPVIAQGLWIPNEQVEGLELLYDAAVGRQPDASGLSGYGALLSSGTSFQQVANQMASSAEFASAHASQTDAQFVDSLYVAEVGRHADPTGLAAYTDQLAHGYTRGDILYETAFSLEHQSHVLAFSDPLLG